MRLYKRFYSTEPVAPVFGQVFFDYIIKMLFISLPMYTKELCILTMICGITSIYFVNRYYIFGE